MQRRQVAYWLAILVSLAGILCFMVGWGQAVDWEKLGVDKDQVVSAGKEMRSQDTCEVICDRTLLETCTKAQETCSHYGDVRDVLKQSYRSGYMACAYATEDCAKAYERCIWLCERTK